MRQVLTPLAALAACAAVLGPVSVTLAPASARAHAPERRRSWTITLSPAVADLALAQVSFPHAARGARAVPGRVGVDPLAPFGDDFIVAGALERPRRGLARVLVLVVNRPSALLDPVHVRLRASSAAALGSPRVMRAGDPFTHPAGAPPALCDLTPHGRPLPAGRLSVLADRGAALAGLSATAALAGAYDALCHLAYPAALRSDISAPSSAPTPAPTPTPTPVPTPPGCTPCTPAAAHACPLAQPAICLSRRRTPARAAGAH